MTFKSHLESRGERCPKCDSRAIKTSDTPKKIRTDTVHVAMFCATCGARWRNIYTLSKSEEL
ncbi:hypothetical protein UWK_00341 [Desulfocapsa sulfexigens DSM 10523]|uniref:Uncharacterized protein n=1 Tax=Desulfocapsa sulfexigens (strain DSM 10523 / SB164P1) TaxID=1167006 RepID=M1PK99_DESSD|nr:hypothetical protein [Desulfocapsa sulfexigens]AGF76926.1 hypothetical protein UWK_00341 [Desulfocapsa sulfexigens DSM 10523]